MQKVKGQVPFNEALRLLA